MRNFKWHDEVFSEKALRIVHTVCGRHDTFEMWIDPAVMETDPPIEVNADGSPIEVVHCYQRGAMLANCGSVGRGQRFITEPITCPNCLSFKPEHLHDWTDWDVGESVKGSTGMEGRHCWICHKWETRPKPKVEHQPDPDVELVERLGEIIWKAPNETAAARDVLAELRSMGWARKLTHYEELKAHDREVARAAMQEILNKLTNL